MTTTRRKRRATLSNLNLVPALGLLCAESASELLMCAAPLNLSANLPLLLILQVRLCAAAAAGNSATFGETVVAQAGSASSCCQLLAELVYCWHWSMCTGLNQLRVHLWGPCNPPIPTPMCLVPLAALQRQCQRSGACGAGGAGAVWAVGPTGLRDCDFVRTDCLLKLAI